MVKFIEMECPNCGAKLQKTGKNMAKCHHCGADFLVENKNEQGYDSNTTSGKGISAWVAGSILLALLILFVIVKAGASDGEVPAVTKNDYSQNKKEQGITSEFFRRFVTEAYKKPFDKVTKEQLAQITYMHLFWEKDCDVVEYTMNDGDVQRIELPDDLARDLGDVKNFTGLKSLDIGRDELSVGELLGLEDLTEIRSGNTPEELLTIVEDPNKIVIMGCYLTDSIAKIDQFENLESLYVESYGSDGLTDISGLSALKKLKTLQIVRGDAIEDFGVLHSLTGLEELAIDSENLKEVSFLEKMTSLKKLSIENSIVLDISALKKTTSITELKLVDNYEIRSYDVLSELVNLESLNLDLCSTSYMPDVSAWKKLKELTVSGAEDIAFLTSLPTLQKLHISGCDCSAYEVLASLQNLESLKLSGIYGDVYGLDVLTQLKHLRSLDISSMSLYGNVEVIFGIPALEELNINDCSFGLDFETMPENDNLRVLQMDRLELWENIDVSYDGMITYLDYDEVALDDHMSFVGKFPALEELYLQSNKLTDVAFVESIPKLRKLDVTDNYITDLRPLGGLQHLEVVWCGENAISQGTDLLEDVIVVVDSEAKDDWW